MTTDPKFTADSLQRVVEQCVRRELTAGAELPGAEEDLVECGAVDSMAWVGVVRCIEAATGVDDFGDRMMDQPRSVRAMMAVLQEGSVARPRATIAGQASSSAGTAAALAGWGEAIGARRVAAAELEREFGLKAGKIATAAGIESVARVPEGEDEVALALRACSAALSGAKAGIGDVDCLLATSETHVGFPSLAARMHAALLADERCAAVDVGGGCLGLVNALHTARALLAAGAARRVLLVTADVHSRMLTPERVKGEFGALFGDGASAFVLQSAGQADAGAHRLGEVMLGCDASAAAAISVGLTGDHDIHLVFEGEALSRAALSKLEEIIEDLELRTGCSRHDAAAFATHQPNPRLLRTLARQMKVPPEKFPPVALTCGNLGSSTCGVALARALNLTAADSGSRPIFVASLGPGLLFGGLVISRE